MLKNTDSQTSVQSASDNTRVADAHNLAFAEIMSSEEIQLLPVYDDEIEVRLPELPSLQPRVLPTRSSSSWRRFLEAGRRRTFTLNQDFVIDVSGETLPEHLCGTIVIPSSSNGVTNVFDGASIPLPWVISYLSFGVLRPLGILLVGSVVHDFAYQFGYLPIRNRNGEVRQAPVARHEADELFRQITGAVNKSRFFSRLAWHAVRLGWWVIPYAGQRWTGEKPVQSTVLAVIASAIAVLVGMIIVNTLLADLEGLGVPTALLGVGATFMAVVYGWVGIAAAKLEKTDRL